MLDPRHSLLVAAACTAAASAQAPFGGPATVAGGASCIDTIVAADLDGDGDPDALLGSLVNNRVSWLENRGGGSFGPPQTIATMVDAHGVRAADIDGDGAPDILVADHDANQVLWYPNQGGGVFGAAQPVTSAFAGPRWVEAEDLDGDGDLDVLLAAEVAGQVAWVENLGGGTFGASVIVDGAAPLAWSVASADLDGDGDADVVAVADGNGVVAWYQNLGAGVFGSRKVLSTFGGFRPEVGVADYDGNGAVDVLFGAGGCSVYGCANSGGGTFAPPAMLSPGFFCGGPTTFDAADHDLDGDTDLIVGWFTYLNWAEALGGGAFGTFWAVHTNLTGCPGAYRQPAASLDADGDGDLDVLTFAAPGSIVRYTNTTIAYEDCNGNGVHDPLEIASGAGTDVNLNAVLDECEEIGTRYCTPAILNSTGAPGVLLALGSDVLAQNDVTLGVLSAPATSFGYFLASQTQGFAFPVSNSQGALCLSGSIGRFVGPGQILVTTTTGTAALGIDVTVLPTPMGPVAATPGSTWNFTFWHRDANPTSTSNFTDAVAITFQ